MGFATLNPSYINDAAILTDNAKITVLNKNPIKPCNVASRRSFLLVMFTSET
jgi:hypothetical protein